MITPPPEHALVGIVRSDPERGVGLTWGYTWSQQDIVAFILENPDVLDLFWKWPKEDRWHIYWRELLVTVH